MDTPPLCLEIMHPLVIFTKRFRRTQKIRLRKSLFRQIDKIKVIGRRINLKKI